MLNKFYQSGKLAALNAFNLLSQKQSNLLAGASAYNPTVTGQAGTSSVPQAAPPPMATPPRSPTMPIASGAPKAQPLG